MILLFILAVLLVVLSICYPNADLIGLGLVFASPILAFILYCFYCFCKTCKTDIKHPA